MTRLRQGIKGDVSEKKRPFCFNGSEGKEGLHKKALQIYFKRAEKVPFFLSVKLQRGTAFAPLLVRRVKGKGTKNLFYPLTCP